MFFTGMKKAVLATKTRKCVLGTNSIKFLGHPFFMKMKIPQNENIEIISISTTTYDQERNPIILKPNRILHSTLCDYSQTIKQLDKKRSTEQTGMEQQSECCI